MIKNPDVLRSNYIPENLQFREDLIKGIKNKLKIGVGNILLHGGTGSGKTASVLNAIRDEDGLISVYLDCVEYSSYSSIAKEIIYQLKREVYNTQGKDTSYIAEYLKKVLTTKRTKKFVLIFDEVDKLINQPRDHQKILRTIAENTNSNIILISNDTNALRKLDPRIESRLSLEKKFIRQYFSNEIFEILKERAKAGLKRGSYDLAVIAGISKYIFQTTGDLRDALNLLYEVSILAEKNNNKKITLGLLDEAIKNVGEVEFDEVFLNLPDHQKIIIAGITKLASQEPEGFAEHKSLYNFYEITVKNHRNLGGRNLGKPVKFRQFENLLKKLEIAKLICVKIASAKQRRGRVGVSFPNYDIERFMENYFPKYEDINATTHRGGV